MDRGLVRDQKEGGVGEPLPEERQKPDGERVVEPRGRLVHEDGGGSCEQQAREKHALLLAALYHDVGKCYQQTEILSKPGRLTDSEYAAMKRHPIDSFNLLSARFSPDVARIARGHHERLDGSGYPDGLTADQMSLEIRILSAVDTFDAMTSDRPYKKGMSTRSAIAELTTLSHQYDAEVVALLKAIVEDGTADQICRIGVEEKR